MKKSKQNKLLKRMFCGFWAVGLGAITILLLTATGEERNFEHYVKLYGAAVLWFIFIVFALGLEQIVDFKIIAGRYDKILVLIPLALIFIILLAMFIQALLSLHLFTTLLLSLFIFGLFNAMKDMLTNKK